MGRISDRDELPICLSVEGQADKPVVGESYRDLGDAGLEVAEIGGYTVPVLRRALTIGHCEADRLNEAPAYRPVDSREPKVFQVPLCLFTTEKGGLGPDLDWVGRAAPVDSSVPKDYLF